jgi:hypothetical protein
MKRLEFLIEDSRKHTENETFSLTAGISTEEFVVWANSANERLQSRITMKSQKIFTAEFSFNLVRSQEAYPLPRDIYIENRVALVEFSPSGRDRDFFVLDPGSLKERGSFILAQPRFYIRRGGELVFVPIPDNARGKIRVTYIKRLPKVDIRRARIDSVTTAGQNITALTLDTAVTLDADALNKYTQFSVVDLDGNQTMRYVPFTNIDTSTGIVTVDPAFAFETTESIAAGNYLVSGPDTANAPRVPDTLERYYFEYMNLKAFKRDSSTDSAEATQEFIDMETEILDLYGEPDDDITSVPVLSTEFTGDEYI